VNGSNANQLGHQDDISNLNDAIKAQLDDVGAIRLPLVMGNVVFHVTKLMLQLLHMKGSFEGLAHEDSYEHIRNFMDVCGPFVFENITQESVRLKLFPFSIMGEATRWLVELLRETITSWEELTKLFYVKFFPPSRMMKLRDHIQNFKQIDGETIHETWVRFQNLLLKCPTHGLLSIVLLQYFYWSLDSINKGVSDHMFEEESCNNQLL